MQKKNPIQDISVLIVDDSELILHSFSQLLKLRGFTAFTANSGEKALNILSEEKVDIVLADMKLPGMNGIELLRSVKSKYPDKDVIIITGYAAVNDAVKTIKNGASDYILKPFTIDEVIHKIINLQTKRKTTEVQKEKAPLPREPHLLKIIANTSGMKKALEIAKEAAATDNAVLITGEKGVGKDALARLIHKKSARRNQPFVRVNCSELCKDNIESELFGREKKPIHGVISRRIGKLELANKGTLYLEEVDEMPTNVHKDLLKVLLNNKFKRVVGLKSIKTDVRIIASSHITTSNSMVKEKLIKSFINKLACTIINVPPLRERKDDVILLAEHFLMMATGGKKRIKLKKKMKDMLLSYNWPGNVRELKITLDKAVVFSQGWDINIEKQLLQSDTSQKPKGIFTLEYPCLTVDNVEKSLLLRVLKNANWNIQQSARLLKISSTSLHNKIRKHGLESFKNKDELIDQQQNGFIEQQ